MDDKNPLLINPVPPNTSLQRNSRGRPTLQQVIRFSSPPKSLVSQILQSCQKDHKNEITKASFCRNKDEKDAVLSIMKNVQKREEKYVPKGEDSQVSKKERVTKSIVKNIQQRKKHFTLNHKHSQIKNRSNGKLEACDILFEEGYTHDKIVNHSDDTIKLSAETEIMCDICSNKSVDWKEHKKHVAVHKEYKCDYPNCSYVAKLSSNLIKHKRIHTTEKPYLCDQCSFRTKFINSLKTHKRIHTTERPHLCKFCDYKCNSSSNLKKHCRHRHAALSV